MSAWTWFFLVGLCGSRKPGEQVEGGGRYQPEARRVTIGPAQPRGPGGGARRPPQVLGGLVQRSAGALVPHVREAVLRRPPGDDHEVRQVAYSIPANAAGMKERIA